jgi:hypothetical protein
LFARPQKLLFKRSFCGLGDQEPGGLNFGTEARMKIFFLRATCALLLGRVAAWRLRTLLLLLWCRRFARLVGGFAGLKLCSATGAGGGWGVLSRS